LFLSSGLIRVPHCNYSLIIIIKAIIIIIIGGSNSSSSSSSSSNGGGDVGGCGGSSISISSGGGGGSSSRSGGGGSSSSSNNNSSSSNMNSLTCAEPISSTDVNRHKSACFGTPKFFWHLVKTATDYICLDQIIFNAVKSSVWLSELTSIHKVT
jgi:hypothetical protein